jgi:hypothetical protein
MVVGGGYYFPFADLLTGFWCWRLCLGRGRHLQGVSPLCFFPAKFVYLNLMGCVIGPFAHLGLYLYFWALPQSSSIPNVLNAQIFIKTNYLRVLKSALGHSLTFS